MYKQAVLASGDLTFTYCCASYLSAGQFWGQVEDVGVEALGDEVAGKKRVEIFAQVSKACSVGAQMTLIMGGGALLFRWDHHHSLVAPR